MTYHRRHEPQAGLSVKRRTAIKAGGTIGAALATLGLVEAVAYRPLRQQAKAANTPLPDIQFDIGNFIGPAKTLEGVEVRFGPVFTLFATARLTRTPTRTDQVTLASALNTIEASYPFSPEGVFTFVSYGLPYFNRLPGGARGSLVSNFMPRLASNRRRPVLEEAVPSPTDVGQPGITKRAFNLPVRIERNDMLFTFRSDDQAIMQDVLEWLTGSNRLNGSSVASPRLPLTITSARVMFQQEGLPRKVADENGLPFAGLINPESPMWMGFFDQQTDSSGPAAITTFVGNASARVTSARRGDYFDNGSIQHLSHVILDLPQFYDQTGDLNEGEAETFLERVQYMFRSTLPLVSRGNEDQFTDGGGPSCLANAFLGPDNAEQDARGINTEEGAHRIGHESALQRSSRAADGTPMHIRMDGTGFDELDVPDGSKQPKLQFTVFVPSADFFTTMRRNSAALDLQRQFDVEESDNGLERFMTPTRRQNFLVPPRRHRAFPLVELAGRTGGGGGGGGTGGIGDSRVWRRPGH